MLGEVTDRQTEMDDFIIISMLCYSNGTDNTVSSGISDVTYLCLAVHDDESTHVQRNFCSYYRGLCSFFADC